MGGNTQENFPAFSCFNPVIPVCLQNMENLTIVKENPIKKTASGVLLVIIFFLMLFPFINSMNQFLVKIIEPLIFFKPAQDILIPYEVRIIRVILDLINIPMTPYAPGAIAITVITKSSGSHPLVVAWNCLGWQSLLVIAATFLTGLRGSFTLLSKLELLVIGLLGTFLFNFVRLSLIFVLYYFFGQREAMIFHDYGSVVITILWLFGLWYYAFNFVLVSKSTRE